MAEAVLVVLDQSVLMELHLLAVVAVVVVIRHTELVVMVVRALLLLDTQYKEKAYVKR
jgi:hypothetical protein